jgi:hypothetical protein
VNAFLAIQLIHEKTLMIRVVCYQSTRRPDRTGDGFRRALPPSPDVVASPIGHTGVGQTAVWMLAEILVSMSMNQEILSGVVCEAVSVV